MNERTNEWIAETPIWIRTNKYMRIYILIYIYIYIYKHNIQQHNTILYSPVSSVLKIPSPPQHIAAMPPTGRTSTVTEDSKHKILFPSTNMVSRSFRVFLMTVPIATRKAHSPFSTVWTITIIIIIYIYRERERERETKSDKQMHAKQKWQQEQS